MKIQFTDPNKLLEKERNSKLLDVNSDLVKFLVKVRDFIKTKYPDIKGEDRPWHIELNRSRRDKHNLPAEDAVVTRARSLHGTEIDEKDVNSYSIMMNRAFVLNTPAVEVYGDTHITIAYFHRADLTDEIADWIKKGLSQIDN